MALVYYDIFTFLLLLTTGALIESKKKAALILLSLSLCLTAASAYFFFTSYLDYGGGVVDKTVFSAPHSLGAYESRDASASVKSPYELYVAFFLIVWIKYYCFSFLISRGIRFVYFNFFKKVV